MTATREAGYETNILLIIFDPVLISSPTVTRHLIGVVSGVVADDSYRYFIYYAY